MSITNHVISTNARIILASGSSIRADILRGAGLNYEVISKPVDEAAIKAAMLSEGSRLRDIADALAEAKALRVSRQESGFVIGADQIMVMDGQLFDKPPTIDAARQRLKEMRGKTHKLMGAVVVCENGVAIWRHLAVTKLTVRDFSDEFLETYINLEGEALTKSVGAYRFEGPGAQLFSHVEGDFFSILGLPLLPLLEYFRTRGVIPS
ncbi:septum formation protein [Litorimonas taeanensis]|uniref:Nucleoside triphosphate pyrophosphatase n=1 Tax=Litorimonas taeanensis TaxID=568099 RepID=A0A420WEN7_9PROT|nr:nucleoside triphosphate pyrophosphatase [Litorimonas taeanensis]RKQ69435.1 septum formation protein [Litorimonas taeanensis]